MSKTMLEKINIIRNESSYKKFIELLYEIFELDKGDLDFGIYRILNLRKDNISSFFNGTGKYDNNGLPQQIIDALERITDKDDVEINKEIEETKNKLKELGATKEQIEENPKIKELKSKLNNNTDLTSLQIEIYNELYEFFSRYYDNGDFISKRRYKKDVYAIPYNGEEVKLTWANENQYYIKTATNFNTYAFKVEIDDGTWTIKFNVVNATTEKNNNKESKKRVFMLYDKTNDISDEKKETFVLEKDNKTLNINFIYDIPTDEYKKDVNDKGDSKVTQANIDKNKCYIEIERYIKNNKILSGLYQKLFEVIEKDKKINLFGKNMLKFFAKNQFDYFIHKDLKGFLYRELDFYIKNEIMNIDDIEDETNETDLSNYLIKIKVIKKIAKTIIDFLSEIEDFQKKMYLKKKFIVNTNYIITMDNITDKELIKEIVNNKKQISEWIEYYDLQDTFKNIDADDKNICSIIGNLPIDTKYYDNDFKEKLIENIENIDDKTNGLLFNGDNMQVLKLLCKSREKCVDLCYIDPPYNTGEDGFIYKDNLKDSSWISMFSDRLQYSYMMLKNTGSFFASINDIELQEMKFVCDNIFGIQSFISSCFVLDNLKGKSNDNYITNVGHKLLVYVKQICDESSFNHVENVFGDRVEDKYSERDDFGYYTWNVFMKSGQSKYREDRQSMYYPILVKNNKVFSIEYDEYIRINVGDKIFDDKYVEELREKYVKKGYKFILPINSRNEYVRWTSGFETFNKLLETGDIVFENNTIKQKKRPEPIEKLKYYCVTVRKNLFYKENYSNGTNDLSNIIINNGFGYPKSVELIKDIVNVKDDNIIVLDYFAGSGTTGHAVIDLNREDGGNRKYILVEMGEYFDTVLVPRLKKVIYCNEWKDGKPKNRETSVSQIIKYHTVESYEDTLNNIDVNNLDVILQPEYIKYSFDLNDENIFSINNFDNPFDYKMYIQNKNEIMPMNIDLVETFNYLIGLYVDKNYATKDYKGIKIKILKGTLRTGEKAVVVWRKKTADSIKDNELINKYIVDNNIDLDSVDIIYINGDATFVDSKYNNKIELIDKRFKEEMFRYDEV